MKSNRRRNIQFAVLVLSVGVVLVTAGCQNIFADRGTPAQSVPGATQLTIGNTASSIPSGTLLAAAQNATVAVMPAPIAVFESRPSEKRIGPSAKIAVPILVYHQVALPPADTTSPGLYVRPNDFVAQLRYLQSRGYQAVTLQEVYDCWYGQGTLPERPVVISFDDGNENTFSMAAPLLKSLGWPGVLSLPTGETVGATNMEPEKVRALIAAGWEIDSHTISHPHLPAIAPEELVRELTKSQSLLREQFGVTANFLCYPYGDYDAKTIAAVRAAGYLGATTCKKGIGTSDELYTLKRVWVEGGETLSAFAASLQ